MREPQNYRASRTNAAKVIGCASLVAVLILIAGLVAGNVFYSANVIGFQYDAAVAKWGAQNAEEYEMVVNFQVFGPSGNFHFKVENGHADFIEMLDDTGAPYTPTRTLSPDGLQYLIQDLTVEGQFNKVRRLLATPFDSEVRCSIQFHETMGYVLHKECGPKPGIRISDLESWMTVKSLKILKHYGTPTPTQP